MVFYWPKLVIHTYHQLLCHVSLLMYKLHILHIYFPELNLSRLHTLGKKTKKHLRIKNRILF